MTTTRSTASASDPIAEIRSTRETAERIASEGATEGTDIARLLAGLISHLAGQMEKLASDSSAIATSDGRESDHDGSAPRIADATQEEDVSPQDAPAAAAGDPNASGQR